MQETTNSQPTQKIYTDQHIWRATVFGGPLVAGYLIAENFKAFGDDTRKNRTWIISIIATAIIFTTAFLIPESVKIPNLIFPMLLGGIAYFLAYKYQGEQIKEHIANDGELFSGWRTFAVSLIGAVVTLVGVIGIYLIGATALDPTVTKTFGSLNHEILYSPDNITEKDIAALGKALTQAGFFDNVQQKSVLAKKEGNTIVMVLPVVNGAWNDREALGYFEQLRKDAQNALSDNKFVIALCNDADLEDIKRRIE